MLSGERVDLSFVRCDFSTLNSFKLRTYEVTRTIPVGETLTYGDIALRLGDKRLAQAVGKALGQNPFPIIVPCHRVLGANGHLTGFSANGGIDTKLRLLSIEGAAIGDAPTLLKACRSLLKQPGPIDSPAIGVGENGLRLQIEWVTAQIWQRGLRSSAGGRRLPSAPGSLEKLSR